MLGFPTRLGLFPAWTLAKLGNKAGPLSGDPLDHSKVAENNVMWFGGRGKCGTGKGKGGSQNHMLDFRSLSQANSCLFLKPMSWQVEKQGVEPQGVGPLGPNEDSEETRHVISGTRTQSTVLRYAAVGLQGSIKHSGKSSSQRGESRSES